MPGKSINSHGAIGNYSGIIGNYHNNVLVLGGYHENLPHKKTEIFDLTNGVWTETTECPFGNQ